MNKYRCKHCGKIFERDSDKKWIKSFCEYSGISSRLVRIDSPTWIIFDEELNTWKCSECGMLWMFDTGTPKSNEAYYCPRCGIRLIK